MLTIPVLCYHAHIISSNDYAGNAHVALAEDLELIQACGRRIVPLHWIVDWLEGLREDAELENAVGLSFDDGTLLDFQAQMHPQYGNLPGLLPLLQQFARRYEHDQPSVHASCFVIASPLARAETDTNELYGLGWLRSDWWQAAQNSGLLAIENHSWDHNNRSASEAPAQPRGSFTGINNQPMAEHEIQQASAMLALLLGRAPELFAYPYGDCNAYLAEQYFPRFGAAMGLRAAFTVAGRHLCKQDSRWELPRYVHGHHWRDADGLNDIFNHRP